MTELYERGQDQRALFVHIHQEHRLSHRLEDDFLNGLIADSQGLVVDETATIGSAARSDYTVLGNEVNLASRWPTARPPARSWSRSER